MCSRTSRRHRQGHVRAFHAREGRDVAEQVRLTSENGEERMKSLEELKRIKEQTLKEMDLRQAKERGKVIIAMGTCGIAAGAKDTIMAIIEELEKADIHDVKVVQSGCMGLCDKEPTVEVAMKDQPAVIYGEVHNANARRIVREHVQGGNVVADLVIKRENI